MDEASKDRWRRLLPVESRQASFIGHSIEMVTRLPAIRERFLYRGDAPEPGQDVLESACLETWFVHARLLIEFLGVRGVTHGKDFTAAGYGWNLPEGDYADLLALWNIASKHVVHLSLERTPEDVFDVEPADVTVDALVRSANRILDLAAAFTLSPDARLDGVRDQLAWDIIDGRNALGHPIAPGLGDDPVELLARLEGHESDGDVPRAQTDPTPL